MKLYISGGIHITRKPTVEDRVNKITSSLGELEAIFVEGRENIGVQQSDRIKNWATTPFMFLIMGFYLSVILGVAKKVGRSDESVIQELIEKQDIPEDMVYNVDKSPHLIVRENRYAWAIFHWYQVAFYFILVEFLRGWTFIFSLTNIAGILVFISLTVGALSLLSYLHLMMTDRNLHMLRQVDYHRKTKDIDSGCLIVGGKHVSGTKDLCELFDDIELVE
jgi:hypothetical protein